MATNVDDMDILERIRQEMRNVDSPEIREKLRAAVCS